MARKKTIKKQLKKSQLRLPFNKKILYVGIFLLVVLVIFAVAHRVSSSRSIFENEMMEAPTQEMHKIPVDVQKHIAHVTPTLSATVRVPILMYHYIEYVQDKGDTIRQSLDVNPNVFESQIKTLREAGYSFMTAKELSDVLDGKANLPDKPILLTFDDGHWDFDTVALPILEKYHVKATAYIISGFIGGSDFMTQKELENVIASGIVEVGAHTVHHIALKGQPLSLVTFEIDQSKKDLESEYGLHVVSFAYPSGSFDQQAIQTVKDAGFTSAVSTIPGIEQSQVNRFFLYRLRPGYRTGDTLLSWLQQNTFNPY